MDLLKKIGVYMDHSKAHFAELLPDNLDIKTLFPELIRPMEKEEREVESEKIIHFVEQKKQLNFYTEISEIVKNYDHILLFGPTDAKLELFNLLKADHHFSAKKIEVKITDYLTENQEYAFILDHFYNSLRIS